MKIKKKYNTQKSFYFEDYNHNFQKKIIKKLNINEDRIYLLFFYIFFH